VARHALFALLALLVALPAPAARAQVVIADRGGPLRDGEPRHAEGSLPAVREAAALGAGVGVDARVSADGVPFALPDADLGRLTSCSGSLAQLPALALAGCALLGPAPAPVPTLRAALAEAAAGAGPLLLTVAPEDLGRLPAILETVPSALSPAALLVRSASPEVLLAAAAQRPGTQLALLTQDPAAPGPHGWAAAAGPVDAAWVAAARAGGRRVLLLAADGEAARGAAALGADALLTPDPAGALAALGRPVPLVAAAPEPPLPELLHPSLASDGATSERTELRWRGGILAEVRPREATAEADWRLLARDGARGAATFTGAPGTAYVVRVRGPGGRAAQGALVVPLDDDDPAVRRSRGGWRRVRGAGAWGGRVLLARRRGATLRLTFRGSLLRVVAPLAPDGGRLRIRMDGAPAEVSLRGPAARRQVVFASPRLEPRRHAVTLTALGGGPVALDALAPE